MTPQINTFSKDTPPTEQYLRIILSNGPACVPIAQALIDKWKAPFIINVDDETGIGTLAYDLTDGDKFLQRFITNNVAMLKLKGDVVKINKTPYEVMIIGETGVGKELISRAMIGNRQGPCKAINCAAMPENLLESELFGHKRGAFTDAVSDKKGLIASANGGVFILDEIGELPLHTQSKLLRVLQDKCVRRVGSNDDEGFDCKFVCATNRNLKQMVKDGLFRKDLYARLHALELFISPLSDRLEDCEAISQSLDGGAKFWEKYGSKIMARGLSLEYNVRSLQAYIIQYKVLGEIRE